MVETPQLYRDITSRSGFPSTSTRRTQQRCPSSERPVCHIHSCSYGRACTRKVSPHPRSRSFRSRRREFGDMNSEQITAREQLTLLCILLVALHRGLQHGHRRTRPEHRVRGHALAERQARLRTRSPRAQCRAHPCLRRETRGCRRVWIVLHEETL